ncbi:MAG TPA: HAD-IB family hydrolase [Candidatus Aquilonibacter sp.]|nr:HAD-IB family hydrolase [Candidatus Aquilonibacter sp.]
MSASRGIAAFFDIDGTLLPSPSLEMRFASWLYAREFVTSWQIATWTAVSLASLLTGEAAAFKASKTYLTALPTFLVQRWEASLGAGALGTYPQAAERIAWHLDQNHRVFLVSGTLAPLADVFARRLGVAVGLHATSLEEINGHFTGLISGIRISGTEKTNALEQRANEYGISLADSYAYGNHFDDLPMLRSVGNPVAVNPTFRLRHAARRQRWPIASWNTFRSASTTPENALLPEESR